MDFTWFIGVLLRFFFIILGQALSCAKPTGRSYRLGKFQMFTYNNMSTCSLRLTTSLVFITCRLIWIVIDFTVLAAPLVMQVLVRGMSHPPPCSRRMYREFSRFDYSHDATPMVVPHVKEYEHGLWARGIPVYDPRVPPLPL